MTTHRYKRCAHCGAEYTYQGSGHGCGEPLNDPTWCPSCKQAVLNGLRAVPRRFECRYRSIAEMPEQFPDITLDSMLEWEKLQLAPRSQGAFLGQRIWPGLYNLATGDAQSTREVVGQGAYEGVRFRLSTWKVDPEVVIDVPMEYDLIEQQYTGAKWPGWAERR